MPATMNMTAFNPTIPAPVVTTSITTTHVYVKGHQLGGTTGPIQKVNLNVCGDVTVVDPNIKYLLFHQGEPGSIDNIVQMFTD